MKIKYCPKYEKYVSQYSCEIFNAGSNCPYYSTKTNSIKELLNDPERPEWAIGEVIKPLKFDLLSGEYYLTRRRRERISERQGRIA